MTPTFRDDDLLLLLGQAGLSYDVPPDGPAAVLAARTAAPHSARERLRRRRVRGAEGHSDRQRQVSDRPWLKVLVAAAVVVGAVAVGTQLVPSSSPAPMAAPAAAGGTPAAGDPKALSNLNLAYNPASGLLDTRSGGAAAPGGDAHLGLAQAGPSPATDGRLALSPGAATAPLSTATRPGADTLAPAGTAATAPSPDGARVVRTGQVALLVDNNRVTPTLTAVQQAAVGLGGLVFGSSTQESGPTPSGTITVRVPVAQFEPLVLRVRQLSGVTVRSAETSAKDVTAQFSDTETQIRSLTAARERFLAILAKANDVGQILAVQQRVDDVSGQIDRLQGQQKVLADQSDLSTLAVTVTQKDDPIVAPAQRPESGLSTAITRAKNGFTSGVEGLVAGSGRFLLALICLLALAVVARLGYRVLRRRLV